MLALSTFLLYLILWINFDFGLYGEYVTSIKWYNGLLMFSLLVGFSYFLIWKSRKHIKAEKAKSTNQEEVVNSNMFKDVAFIILGSIGLSYGAHLLVEGTVGLATVLGISDYVISVTIVALGTSLPELITSVVAAFKKHSDLSVGNLIGSNIFNILGILGITSLFKEIPVSAEALYSDMVWLIAITIILFPMMVTRKLISKLEGVILFSIYVIYIYTSFV